ncbi:hypothetical protein ACUOFC_63255, partial [Escherichia sp. TWPC-MK]
MQRIQRQRLLKRPSLNLLAWLLLAAFYISICLNIAFFKQVLQALPLKATTGIDKKTSTLCSESSG